MSTDTERLSIFDTWCVREAARIVDDLDFIDIEGIEGEHFAKAVKTVADECGASTAPPADFDSMLQRFRELTDARKAAEDQANYWRTEAAKLETLLVEAFGANGTQSIKRDGKTFYLCREFQVSADAARRAELVEAMKQLGHDDFIVCQPQRLAAYCREMLADESAGLPVEIKDLVKVHEQQRLRVRNS